MAGAAPQQLVRMMSAPDLSGELATLYRLYASGELEYEVSVQMPNGTSRRVRKKFGSLAELWTAIQNIERAIAAPRRPSAGVAAFGRGDRR